MFNETANGGFQNPEEGIVIENGGLAISPAVRAEIDIQIATAKHYPRSIKAFKQQALDMATFDEETASGCFYSMPRGGKPIEGPSARLAEIVLSAWGNVRADARVVGHDDKEITAEAMTWDLEKNVAIRVQVKRRITGRDGKTFNADMITVTGNAACSIALRNSVFKVIPMVYTKSIYQQARMVAIGDISTLEAKRAEAVAYFGKMGIVPERVLAVIGKVSIEDVGLDDVATLKGLATAIKDGDTSIDEAFPPVNGNGNGKKPDAPPTISEEQRMALFAAAKESGQNLAEIITRHGFAIVANVPIEKYDEILADASKVAGTDDVVVDEGNEPDEASAETSEPMSAIDTLRANVQAKLDEFPKSRQKDLLVGKPSISKMTEVELTEFAMVLQSA